MERQNSTIVKVTSVVIGLAVILATVAAGYGVLNNQVKNHDVILEKHTGQMDFHGEVITQMRVQQAKTEIHIEKINESIVEIKGGIKEINKKLEK